MNSREKILASAELLFATQGFDNTTMDQVARQAGLTKGAVYYFFKSKADLFCQLVDPGLRYIEQQSRRILNNDQEDDEKILNLINCFVDLVYQNEKIVRILLGSQSANPAVRGMFDLRVNQLLRWVETLLFAGVTGNFLMPVSVTLYAKLIVGMMYGMIALPDPPAKERAVQAMQTMFRSLYR